MLSLPSDFKAIILGYTGTIGNALFQNLSGLSACSEIIGLGRQSIPSLELTQESSIQRCAQNLQARGPYHLIINAMGTLTVNGNPPEKRLQDVYPECLQHAFAINAIGPLLVMKHFIKLLPRNERAIFATLSARVGSISDNHKGGWYGYRASKAALNMFIQNVAIEVTRLRPNIVFAAIQPGTVKSKLSAPYLGNQLTISDIESAQNILMVLDQLPAINRAHFIDHRGVPIEW